MENSKCLLGGGLFYGAVLDKVHSWKSKWSLFKGIVILLEVAEGARIV